MSVCGKEGAGRAASLAVGVAFCWLRGAASDSRGRPLVPPHFSFLVCRASDDWQALLSFTCAYPLQADAALSVCSRMPHQQTQRFGVSSFRPSAPRNSSPARMISQVWSSLPPCLPCLPVALPLCLPTSCLPASRMPRRPACLFQLEIPARTAEPEPCTLHPAPCALDPTPTSSSPAYASDLSSNGGLLSVTHLRLSSPPPLHPFTHSSAPLPPLLQWPCGILAGACSSSNGSARPSSSSTTASS